MRCAETRTPARPRAGGDPDSFEQELDSRLRGNERRCRRYILVALAIIPTAAHAHPGDHSRFDWGALAGHLLEPDHLVFLALIVVVGLLAFVAGQRVERRARERDEP